MSRLFVPGILVLSAPSGGGKTSLAQALAAQRDDVEIAVSHTTRKRRGGEKNGVHYYFVDDSCFKQMIRQDAFIEYAQVYDHYYGTSCKAVESLTADGKHVILDIDWQGARSIRQKYPEALTVFIIPPSLDMLEKRLRIRNQDNESVIYQRMIMAEREISHKDEFNLIIVNDDFNRALKQVEEALNSIGTS